MNEEIDESEFYHQDFTTASEWEVFMARMEEIINQWKTDDMKNEKITDIINVWDIRSEKLTFADTDFLLHAYKMDIETPDNSESSDEIEKQNDIPIDSLYDFELYNENNNNVHSCLSTWYGLKEYIVLAPTNNVNITSENKIKILLSSAYIVSNNTNCGIPIFVQIRERWQNCYLGVFENEAIRTNFEMVHLNKGPPQCSYLNGLLDLFKTKIMSPCNIENILVSVQMTYTLTDFGNFIWKQELLEGDFDTESLFILPFGVSVDPINSIILKATWSHLPDHLIIDSEIYSDLDPIAAPKWSCSANITYEPVCLLGEALSEFFQNLSNNSSIYNVLGDFAASLSMDSNPLDLLTEPAVPAITALLSRAARHSLSRNRRANPPINESVLVPMLYFLFPDADEKSTYPYGWREDNESLKRNDSNAMCEEDFKGFKTVAADSLCWRLSIVLAHALQSLGGVKAFCHVWYEFVQEMRYRWEKSMPIPG
ncbi:unnamed protein product [Phaedon cochleariae]|uniref:Rab3 GTPase-activating protein catalytic subunit n=1 Tax=Phaedon cochleariae TaxID=80249 RepID=A0A9N9SQA0_PHACE|nr:unnamed protein product [Phaedon cochleariae]